MEQTKVPNTIPQSPESLLTSSLSSSFQKKIPLIGISRKLKQIPYDMIDNTSLSTPENKQFQFPTTTLEQCESHSKQIFQKYKDNKCIIIYSDNEEEKNQIGNNISFKELVDLVQSDTFAFDSFINEKYGEWVNEDNNERNYNYIDKIAFDAKFEQGNLRMAIKVDENEYDLIMRKDFNNEKNYSWFFYQIISHTEREIKFNIINFPKNRLLFSNSARILTYNQKEKWSRNTYNVFYFENEIPITNNLIDNTNNPKDDDNNEKETIPIIHKFFTTLTFSFKVTKDLINKPILFSYCYPYNYSTLQNYLYNLSINNKYKEMIKFSTLGKTLCGNPLDIIYITDWSIPESRKSTIFFTARVHPGESNSSLVIEGVINTLLSEIGKDLRRKFVFKIIPMLNPDGVINGNYRNNLMGKDLNRMWPDPRNNVSPTIFNTKKILWLSKPVFYCDFHGHSALKNCCLYGCSKNPKKSKHQLNKKHHFNEEKVFIKLFEKLAEYYNKEGSRFKISKKKYHTARAIAYNELSITMSYCLETSTISTSKDDVVEGFTIERYYKVGMEFVQSLIQWNDKENFFRILKKMRVEAEVKKKQKELKLKKKSNSDNTEETHMILIKKKKQLTLSGDMEEKNLMFISNEDKRNVNIDKFNMNKTIKTKRAESENKRFTGFV